MGTELIYEVDAQSAPLRAMASMLREVRSGKFMPDNPRGQQLAEECERSDEEDPPHSEDDMASSSGSSVDEEERDHSEPSPGLWRGGRAEWMSGGCQVMQRTSGTASRESST